MSTYLLAGSASRILLRLAASLVILNYAVAQEPAAGSRQAAGDALSVVFTVVDKDGRAIDELKKEDVRVLVDGTAQPAAGLGVQSDAPLALAVVLDVSVSQERVLEGAKRAAEAFVGASMRPGTDSAAVVTFTNETSVVQSMTGDLRQVRAGIGRARVVLPPGYVGRGVVIAGPPPPGMRNLPGSTAMWDAVAHVAGRVVPPRAAPGPRRAVIIVTDGVDTSSRIKSDEAVKAAIRAGVAVYAVGLRDKEMGEVDRGALRKLAGRTGGRAFFPGKGDELRAALAQIREELRSQYVLTFAAPAAGREAFRKLRVEVVSPELRRRDLQLSHPHGYFEESAGRTPR